MDSLLEPISGAALAEIEVRRRDLVQGLGPCPTGCDDLDRYVLISGGLPRGCVAGISAEDEDGLGVKLGLQILINSLLGGASRRAMIVTPKPQNAVLVPLTDGISAALAARGLSEKSRLASERKECLDKIMLSCVFDMDGLMEVLADLDKGDAVDEEKNPEPKRGSPPAGDHTVATSDGRQRQLPLPDKSSSPGRDSPPRDETRSVTAEIQDSQDEDEDEPSPSPDLSQPAAQQHDEIPGPARHPTSSRFTNQVASCPGDFPDIIVITHFSSILTSFFTQREKSAAHQTLRFVGDRLRRLSRTLPSHPLILLLNSADSTAAPPSKHIPGRQQDNPTLATPTPGLAPLLIDPTLRSVFSTNPTAGPSPSGQRAAHKVVKPSFGLVFTQLLELHLFCTKISSSPLDAAVIEVLLDDVGIWKGERGKRQSRERRWAAVVIYKGQVMTADDAKASMATE